MIGNNVPAENRCQFAILWRYDSGVHPILHKDYIDEFCEACYELLMKLITNAAAVARSQKVERAHIYDEVSFILLISWQQLTIFHAERN